jgi:hypothetical protein
VLWLLRLGFLVVALFAVAWTTADPDLWGHVRFGKDIVQSGTLHTGDPYSFTSDHPWINHEWLAEVAMYGSFVAGGPAGLVTLKLLVLIAVLGCILIHFRCFSWSPISHDLLMAVALVGMLPRYHPVRPQLFSLLLFAALLLTLTRTGPQTRRPLMAVPVIFALWANVHGGFLVGLGVLALWLGVRLLQSPSEWATFAVTGVSALAATLVTPYGLVLWRFLWDTVGVGRPAIQDWQPLWALDPLTILIWSLVAATAAIALIRFRHRLDVAAVCVVAILGLLSVRVSRIDAFFTLAVVMLLGPLFASGRRESMTTAPPHRSWAWAAVAILGAAGAYSLHQRSQCIELGSLYPEPEAVHFLSAQRGRLLTPFNWGQYAIWHLSPALKVSMDGRRETVYSDELVDAHLRFYANAPGALEWLATLQPDLIWVPANSPVSRTLETNGWRVSFRGPLSRVFSARPLESPVPPAATQRPRRCFPDA